MRRRPLRWHHSSQPTLRLYCLCAVYTLAPGIRLDSLWFVLMECKVWQSRSQSLFLRFRDSIPKHYLRKHYLLKRIVLLPNPFCWEQLLCLFRGSKDYGIDGVSHNLSFVYCIALYMHLTLTTVVPLTVLKSMKWNGHVCYPRGRQFYHQSTRARGLENEWIGDVSLHAYYGYSIKAHFTQHFWVISLLICSHYVVFLPACIHMK